MTPIKVKIIFAAGLLMVVSVWGQVPGKRVQIAVSQSNENKKYKFDDGVNRSSRNIKIGTVYTIEITNVGGSDLNDGRVVWTFLMQTSLPPYATKDYSLTEGEGRCALRTGEKQVLESATIPVGQSYVKLAGYVVEVFAGTERIAIVSEPRETAQKVERVKAAAVAHRPADGAFVDKPDLQIPSLPDPAKAARGIRQGMDKKVQELRDRPPPATASAPVYLPGEAHRKYAELEYEHPEQFAQAKHTGQVIGIRFCAAVDPRKDLGISIITLCNPNFLDQLIVECPPEALDFIQPVTVESRVLKDYEVQLNQAKILKKKKPSPPVKGERTVYAEVIPPDTKSRSFRFRLVGREEVRTAEGKLTYRW